VLDAVTVTEVVPLGVVNSVGTLNVAVPDALTEPGVTVQVTPAGQPDVTARFTVAVRLGEYVIVRVYVAVDPDPTVWVGARRLL
jgi:hypothetical protein